MFERKDHEEQAFRTVRGLQSLAAQYGTVRLKAACHRANVFGIASLRRIRSMLQTQMDKKPLPDDAPDVAAASLNDIDFNVARGLSKSKFLELAQGQWLHQHLQLVIVEPTGVGKTFLASVLADAFCQQGHSVHYFRNADLLLELKLAKAVRVACPKGLGSFPKRKRQLVTFNLLILNDWLRDPLSQDQARDLLDLLDERYRKAACLFATQLPIPQLHQQIQDPTLADAMLDRIVHDALRFSLKGESMRKLTSLVQPDTAEHAIVG